MLPLQNFMANKAVLILIGAIVILWFVCRDKSMSLDPLNKEEFRGGWGWRGRGWGWRRPIMPYYYDPYYYL